MKRLIISTSIFLWGLTQAYGQGNANNYWYFGDNPNGIRFSRNEDKSASLIDNQATPFGMMGAASAADALTGNLFFYSDGRNIYDRSHQIMPGGNNLPADVGKSQPVVIVPHPNNQNQYFVYLNTENNGLQFVTVDVSQAGNGVNADPLGIVINTPQNTAVNAPSDAMRVLGNNGNYWLILQDRSSNQLSILQVANNGQLNVIASSEPFPVEINAKAIDFSTDSLNIMHLALASHNVNGTAKNIQLVDFDLDQLTFSTPEQILNTNNSNSIIEGLSWSISGLKLYFSKTNTANNSAGIFQYNPENDDVVRASTQNFERFLGLKNGPDGDLYFLYRRTPTGNTELGKIFYADSLADSLEFALNVFDTPFNSSFFFPENAPARDINASITFSTYPPAICQNGNIIFFPEYPDLDDINSISWTFGELGSSDALHPIVNFDEGGPLEVNLRITAGGSVFEFSQTVNVQPNDVELQVQDTTICELPFTYNLENPPQGNIFWSNGDTGPSATFEESGNYWVAVESGSCTIFEGFEITLYGEQKQKANIWHFGEEAGIDFNPPGGAVPLTDGAMNAPEGCATISDQNGDLLFYTDGESVWNKTHQIMENGQDIGGNRNNIMSSIIVPFADDATLYYIFLTENVNSTSLEFRYAVVDMKEEEGNGAVVVKGQKLFRPNTERVSALEGGGGYQVLVHDFGNDNYRTYTVGANGLSVADFVQEGVIHSRANLQNGKGYLRQSTDGNKLAVVLQGDRAIDFTRRVPTPQFGNDEDDEPEFFSTDHTYESRLISNLPAEPYGLSFSPDNNFLYVSLRGSNSSVMQFNVHDSLSLQEIDESGIEVFSANEEFGALQLGPDGQMYMAVNGAGYLYRFSSLSLDANDPQNNFPEPTQFDLGGKNSRLGLPNFVQNFGTATDQANMFVTAACSDEPVILQGNGTDPIDRFFWQIYEQGSSTILFSSTQQGDTLDILLDPGNYEASLRVTNECGLDTLMTRRFRIFDSPDLSNVPSSANFCGSTLTLGNQIPEVEGDTYLWSTGESSRLITVTEEGLYRVTVSSVNGCTAEREIFVGPPFDVELGEDQTICQGESITLDANVNADQYRWFLNNVNQNNNSRTFNFEAVSGGDFVVRVEVPDPLDPGCPSTDELTISVNAFEASLSGSTSSACGANEGSLSLSITGSGDYSIIWTAPDGSEITAAANNQTADNLTPGNYTASITDNLSGCNTVLRNLSVNSDDFDITISSTTGAGCDGAEDGSVTFTITGGTAPFTGRVLSNEDGSEVNPALDFTNGTITNIGAGSYTLEISDGTDCISSANFTIGEPDEVNFSLSRNPLTACGNSADLSVNPNFVYNWTGPAAVNSVDPSTFRFTSSGEYTVEVSQAGFCSVIRTLEVILSTRPVISGIDKENDCEGNVILTANLGSGNPNDFTFSWSNGMRGRSIVISNTGIYSLTVTNANNISCSADATAEVRAEDFQEPIELRIESENLCNEEGEIALSAVSNGNQPQYSWYRISNGSRGNAIASSSDIVVGQSGTFEVEVTYSGLGNCPNTFVARRSVEVLPIYEPSFEEVYFICPDSQVESERQVRLDPGSFGSYIWRQGGQVLSNNRVFTITSPGAYTFQTEVAGCTIAKEIIVELDCRPRVHAPNAFKPSSSITENQVFRVFANQYVGDFQIVIFNRWGRMVYRSNDVNFAWNGQDFNGAESPQGTYAYKITYRSSIDTNRVFEERGGVTLIR